MADTALIRNGMVAQVWRNTPHDALADTLLPDGDLVEFLPGQAVCGMLWDGTALSLPPSNNSTPQAVAFISRPQCAREMFERGMITGPEMLAMTRDGTPPAFVEAMLTAMPEPDVWIARADFARYNYDRANPLLNALMRNWALAHIEGLTEDGVEAAIDDFFVAAAAH